MISHLAQNAGWFSILAAVATLLSFAALFIFFAVGGIFGPINDAITVFQMLFLIPVALALHQVFRQNNPGLSQVITIIVIAAMLLFAILQALLVLRILRFEQTLQAVLILGGVVGVWLLVLGILSFYNQVFPTGLAWVSILAGLGFLVGMVGFWLGGAENPLAAVSLLVVAIAVPVWAFWLGRLI